MGSLQRFAQILHRFQDGWFCIAAAAAAAAMLLCCYYTYYHSDLYHCKGVRCPPIFLLSNLINVGWL